MFVFAHVSSMNTSFFVSMVGERFGLSLSGKELFDGFLASNEYVSAMNNLNTITSITCDYSKKKISDRQFCSRLKKYLKRTGQDAADFVDAYFWENGTKCPQPRLGLPIDSYLFKSAI